MSQLEREKLKEDILWTLEKIYHPDSQFHGGTRESLAEHLTQQILELSSDSDDDRQEPEDLSPAGLTADR